MKISMFESYHKEWEISLLRVALMLVVSFSFLIGETSAQEVNPWENPDVNGTNKEKPHAYSFLASEKANNPTVQSLDGIWKFKWSPDPQSRPMDFYTENYSTENWDNILVPGNWELQGFGTPVYT